MKKYLMISLLSLPLLLLGVFKPFGATANRSTSSLVQHQVLGLDNEVVATVEDLVLSANGETISYAAVTMPQDPFSYGKAAFWDASELRTVIPWQYLSVDEISGDLHLKVPTSVLYSAPSIATDPAHLGPGWDRDINAYWQGQALASH